ncbi:MAG: hypothetical protein ABUK01_15505 [Leptospirales bacterium]
MGKQNRAVRIKNWSLGDINFIPEAPGTHNLPTEVPLANISENGIGLWIQDTRVYLAPGTNLKGNIELPGESFVTQLKVLRQHKYVIGCSFVDEDTALSHYLQTHFNVEEKANHLINVKGEFLAERDDGKPHWHTDGISELYYIESGSRITRYRLIYQKHEIYKYYNQPPDYKIEEVIHQLPIQIYDEFIRFINHINELPFGYRKEIKNDLDELCE